MAPFYKPFDTNRFYIIGCFFLEVSPGPSQFSQFMHLLPAPSCGDRLEQGLEKANAMPRWSLRVL
jgi:hypothetical protein